MIYIPVFHVLLKKFVMFFQKLSRRSNLNLLQVVAKMSKSLNLRRNYVVIDGQIFQNVPRIS